MLMDRSVPICIWQGTNARHVPLVCQRNLIALINGATHFNPSFNQNFTSYFAIVGTNVTDFSIGGSRGVLGAGPPTGRNSFVFANIFTEKCPRRRSTSPLPEILDPPLFSIMLVIYRFLRYSTNTD